MRRLRVLTTTALFLCLTALIAQAGSIEQKMPAGRFTVSQMHTDDGERVCGFSDTSTGAVKANYMVLRSVTGRTTFFISFPGRSGTNGTMTVTINGQVYHSEIKQAFDDWMVVDDLTDDFRHDLWNGLWMTVDINGLRTEFSMQGTAAALAVLYRCSETPGWTTTPTETIAGEQSKPWDRHWQQPLTTTTGSSQPQTFKTEVPFTRINNAIELSVTINDSISVTMELDSGASAIVIPRSLARRLIANGSLSRSDYVREGIATLADGQEIKTDVVTLRSLTVAGRTVRDVRCNVGGDGASLLLGRSFLDKFGSWSVDNGRSVLVLND